ncbi:MAG: AAA family ATPase [Fimbriimonas sp.]|nr:AAA family ATPase [Fimbriimonas sp.]
MNSRPADTDFTSPLAWAKNVISGTDSSELHSPRRLEEVASVFGLSEFERAVLAIATCLEIDSSLLASLPHGRLTVGYALDKLADPHWDAFSPSSPLRRWDLIHIDTSSSLSQATIRIDEGVLFALLGSVGLDQPLLQFILPLDGEIFHNKRIDEIAILLTESWSDKSPTTNLVGGDAESQIWVFLAASLQLSLSAWKLDSRLIPSTADGQYTLAKQWTRYAAIHGASLMIEAHDSIDNVRAFAKHLKTPCAIGTSERLDLNDIVHLDVQAPTPSERSEYWTKAIGVDASRLNGKLRQIVEQFDVPPGRLDEVVRHARSDGGSFEKALWNEAKSASRRKLDELAQRIEPVASWDDLVLPDEQRTVLRELVAQVRKRAIVHHDWGFGDRIARGLGIAALFHGASGTGKTLSAEVLAHELGLDLFRIDLSSVVSKYIGETEKNLKKLFDAAERCGAVLLFDEADALFGKRTEVKDSHDRYANIEVGYLLQRMESYRGIAILTTNMKESFDPAFLRRLRFIVSFPFPGPQERIQIWQKSIPKKAPVSDIDYSKLAKLNISGGHIRNIALSAAFLAADEESEIRMSHFRAAAKTEYSKLDRPLLESEVCEWV